MPPGRHCPEWERRARFAARERRKSSALRGRTAADVGQSVHPVEYRPGWGLHGHDANHESEPRRAEWDLFERFVHRSDHRLHGLRQPGERPDLVQAVRAGHVGHAEAADDYRPDADDDRPHTDRSDRDDADADRPEPHHAAPDRLEHTYGRQVRARPGADPGGPVHTRRLAPLVP